MFCFLTADELMVTVFLVFITISFLFSNFIVFNYSLLFTLTFNLWEIYMYLIIFIRSSLLTFTTSTHPSLGFLNFLAYKS